MDYKLRLYKDYTSNIQARDRKIEVSKFDRYGRAYDWYLRRLMPNDKKAKILDVGCGYGRILQFFSKRGYSDVTGVDLSPEQIEFAKKIYPNVIQADALEFLESHQEQFDVILAIDLIEHFTKEEIMRFLDASYQALKPGGQLIIQSPNADSPFGVVHGFGDFTHETFVNISSLSSIMTICGYTGIEGRETGPTPFGIISFIRWILWKFIRFMIVVYNIIETSGPGRGIYTQVFIARAVKPAPIPSGKS